MNVAAFVAVHIATQMAARESRLLKTLREAEAASAESAIPLTFDSRDDEKTFAHLIRKGRVLEAGNGRYYLSETPVTTTRARAVVAACSLLLLAIAAVMIFVIARP